ncbi:hypothetical protein CHUAL_005060 [Chamberlinius hualienensis]
MHFNFGGAKVAFKRIPNATIDLLSSGYIIDHFYKTGSRLQCAGIGHYQVETEGFGYVENLETQSNCYTWMKGDADYDSNYIWPDYENYVKFDPDEIEDEPIPDDVIASSATPYFMELETTTPNTSQVKCPYMHRGNMCNETCSLQIYPGMRDLVNDYCQYRLWEVMLNSSNPNAIADCWEICAWDQSCWGITYDILGSTCYLTTNMDNEECKDTSDKNFFYYNVNCGITEKQ